MRIGIVIAACLVTLQSVLLVLGAWRNDRQIERNMGVAAAEVLNAGPRRSTIEFVTPTGSPTGPSSVCCTRPNWTRACGFTSSTTRTTPTWCGCRTATRRWRSSRPGSIAVVGWLVAGAALLGLAFVERRGDRRSARSGGRPSACPASCCRRCRCLLVVAEVVNRWRARTGHQRVDLKLEVGWSRPSGAVTAVSPSRYGRRRRRVSPNPRHVGHLVVGSVREPPGSLWAQRSSTKRLNAVAGARRLGRSDRPGTTRC